MLDAFEAEKADAVIAFEEVPREDVRNYGIAKPRGAGELFPLADIVEKPAVAEAPSTLAVAARYVFRPGIFDVLATTKAGKGGEIQLTDAIRTLIHSGGKVLGLRLPPDERRYDIGNFESYFEAFVEFALADPQYGTRLRELVKGLVQ
jgi:UTP--glucose-1-phosphate uridylyltransferase